MTASRIASTGKSTFAGPANRVKGFLPVFCALLVAIAAIGMIRISGFPDGWQSTSGALVGKALLGADGKLTVGELVAAYPPLAILPMVGLTTPALVLGVNAGQLFSALVCAALAGLWLSKLIKAGYRPGAALILLALLTCNPLFLGALTAGPESALTLLGTWLFAMSAFSLRNRGSVNDLIACSSALALLAFAGPLGITFAIASMPFLLLLKPADIELKNAVSIYLVLLFPVVFALTSFAFVNCMMLHDAFGFLQADTDLGARWREQSWLTPVVPVLYAVVCSPALVAMLIVVRGRRPLQAVACALLGMLLLSVVLAVQGGGSRSPIEALCPAISLAATAVMRWPAEKSRSIRVALLLMLGLTGAVFAVFAQGRFSWGAKGAGSASEFASIRGVNADQQVGRFLAGRSDVLIDGTAHPAVVAARGGARGLVTGNDTAFALALLRKRIDTFAVAVPFPDASRNEDAITRNLPELYKSGAPGLQLIYDENGWRVWSRQTQKAQKP